MPGVSWALPGSWIFLLIPVISRDLISSSTRRCPLLYPVSLQGPEGKIEYIYNLPFTTLTPTLYHINGIYLLMQKVEYFQKGIRGYKEQRLTFLANLYISLIAFLYSLEIRNGKSSDRRTISNNWTGYFFKKFQHTVIREVWLEGEKIDKISKESTSRLSP